MHACPTRLTSEELQTQPLPGSLSIDGREYLRLLVFLCNFALLPSIQVEHISGVKQALL